MAINKNHEFEELNGVKCAIVEKNASVERVSFLKELLESNNYTVVVVASPPPKVVAPPAPKPGPAEGTAQVVPSAEVVATTQPPLPETFTIGVTDVTFNPTNAIFGRLLHTKNGHVVTLAYWYQQEKVSHDEIPYYEKKP
ncbi:MAG TPA: hypothetical protein VK588_06430 [Chitinophagaceae bacterium]|nr:hypothetical protein [Chitinophagaceae bacterium]